MSFFMGKIVALSLLLFLVVPSAVLAEENGDGNRLLTDSALSADNTALSEDSDVASIGGDFLSLDVLDDDMLKGMRGTFLANLGVADLDAYASNNQTTNSVTGANIIRDDALGGANGVISFIQNSGNNVIIQNSTIVNLNMQ